jgi:sugar phosphate isomerase/epimerase
MDVISRREFLKRSAADAAAVGLLAASVSKLHAQPLGLPLGCQTYPVRDMLRQDFVGTIKQLADIGFESIELCSPVGYEDFAGLAKYTGSELRKVFSDHGVTCVSAHFSMKELRDDLAGRIAWAKDVGLTQMMVPTLAGPENPTMDDVKRVADEYNEMAAQSAKAGLLQGVHNEGFELSMVDGRRTYDVLLELLDPKLVTFQFQISTISRGYDSIEYFTKYPGRFGSMHVQGWSAKTKERTAVGQGTLDWKKIFAAAKTGGVKNYFVEMRLDLMKASVPYLRDLQV